MISDKYKEIINKTSVKERVEAKVIEDIVNKTFLEIRKSLARHDYPTVLINKFCKFKPSLLVIRRTLEKNYKFYDEEGYKSVRNNDHRNEILTKINGYLRLSKEQKREVSELILDFKSKLESLCL